MNAEQYIQACKEQIEQWEAVTHRAAFRVLAADARRNCDSASAYRYEAKAASWRYRRMCMQTSIKNKPLELRSSATAMERIWNAEARRQIAVALMYEARAKRFELEIALAAADAQVSQAQSDLRQGLDAVTTAALQAELRMARTELGRVLASKGATKKRLEELAYSEKVHFDRSHAIAAEIKALKYEHEQQGGEVIQFPNRKAAN